MWVYPNIIQPLFNEFKQLQELVERSKHVKACMKMRTFSPKHASKRKPDTQDASLKEKIEALAAEVGAFES